MGPFGRLAESQPLPLEEQQRQELVRVISNNASNPTADRSDARVIDLVRRGGLHGYTEALASYVQVPSRLQLHLLPDRVQVQYARPGGVAGRRCRPQRHGRE
jgi:hypothetical protein